MPTLDEVLNGDQKETDSRQRDEQGKFVAAEKSEPEQKAETPKQESLPLEAKGEDVTAPPADKTEVKQHEEPSELRGIKSAHMAEKQKRKEAEKRLREYEAKLQELQRPQAPDPSRDPNGYAEHYQNQLIDERVNLSHEVAREKFEDYEDVMKGWDAACQADPSLYQRAITQKLPAEWAYQQLKRMKYLETIGDPEEWMKTQRAQIEAELAAKYAKPVEVPQPSLANATGAGRVANAPAYSGPTPLKQIFRR